MKFKQYLQRIIRELNQYKSTVDDTAVAFVAEKTKHEKDLESMRGTYTNEFIEECRRNWTPKTDYRKIIDFARETHQKIAMSYFDKIKSEMDAYFKVPVDSGFSATVTSIKALGVKLSDREFEVLQGAAGGYWGLRLLNELGTSRTKTEQRAELDNGEMKRVEKEVKTPYTTVRLPNIESAYASLQSAKNALDIAFSSYCGEGYALKDIIFPLDKATEETNAKLTAAYGVQPQKQTLDNLTISKMASSIQFFNENYQSYTELSEIMENLAATMPTPKRKETLTDDDKKLIDTLISSDFPSLAQSDAIKIAKADERLAELLSLDERYSKAVKEALREVSDNE